MTVFRLSLRPWILARAGNPVVTNMSRCVDTVLPCRAHRLDYTQRSRANFSRDITKKLADYAVALLALLLASSALADKPVLAFTKLWTYRHAVVRPGQIGEIPAFDPKTNTVWVAGIAGVDVLDADNGMLIEHLDTRGYGTINSVAIHNGLAAFAIEASKRTSPGGGVLYDTKTRNPADGTNQISVGAGYLAIANEGSGPTADDANTTLYRIERIRR